LRKLIVMGLMLLCVVFFVGTVSAANIPVNPGDSIQAKINTANPGDTLNLSAGTYNQYDINVNKNLTITGPKTTGTPTATINGQNQGGIINIPRGVKVNLKYLSIICGNTTGEGGGIRGGGISNQGSLTVTNCNICNNYANYGGGIFNDHGTCTVTNSNLIGNTAILPGGGIYNQVGTCTVTGSSINYNTAYSGGGIYNIQSNCTVIGSSINHNTAYYGGGIYNQAGTCTVTGSNINHNTANYNSGGISNDYGTCTITSSSINNNMAGLSGGGIYNDFGTCTVAGNSNVNGNTASYGGGIHNDHGTCTVTGHNINFNNADEGAGICNYYGTLTTANSNIKSNIANHNGGGIFNDHGNCTVTSSNLIGNTANINGGGIINQGNLTVTGCNFENNKATNNGNAIYNEADNTQIRTIHYNRFYDPATGCEIYSFPGTIDAGYNWWGNSGIPDSEVYHGSYNNWLVLTIKSASTIIGNGIKTTITFDMTHSILGNQINGNFPNSIPVTFSTTLGTITSTIYLVNGTAKATLTGGTTSGVADVFALLDDQIVKTSVQIEIISPVITKVDPANGSTGVARNKTINVTFNENIKKGSKLWVELKNNSGKAIPFKAYVSGKVLIIDPTSNLAEALYTLVIHTGAVTDLAGNPVSAKSSKFSVGTPPTVTKVDPPNGATKVARNKTIKITFNENIKASSSYWIELVASNGSKVTIKKSISEKVLIITHTTRLAANTKYKLIIHTGAVTDTAGNPVAVRTFIFTTGNT